MGKNINLEGIEFDFLANEKALKPIFAENYKIMIADDYEEVHTITKMILKDFDFDGKGLVFIDTYTGKETIEALKLNPDTAVLFLDVVMEETHSGLEVVETLRNKLNNKYTRIVLRTGQPGQAPEETVIRDYDINDYRLKTEMTAKRLYTTLYAALRGYKDLMQIEKHKNGLKKIIETSASLFEHDTLNEFLTSILVQLADFQKYDNQIVYIRDDINQEEGGFVSIEQNKRFAIVAATGKFMPHIGKNIEDISELKLVVDKIKDSYNVDGKIKDSYNAEDKIIFLENGFIIKNNINSSFNNYIYIEGDNNVYDFDLIHLFLTNYSVALDNYILNKTIVKTQEEIILTFGEVVENHFEETSGHVKRISDMMYNFAKVLKYKHSDAEILKIASTMHDIGKISIPDSILKKPGKLTYEEFEVIKTHTTVGHKIFEKSNLDLLKLAANLALYHHEKYDGTGYPIGLKADEILFQARMLSIVDVFDAMTHKRVYKDAFSEKEATEYIIGQKGKHFDPELVDLFIENIRIVLDIDKNTL